MEPGQQFETIHRGVKMDLGAGRRAFAIADDAGKARIIDSHLRQPLGMSWSRDDGFARDWTSGNAAVSPSDRLHVVLSAPHPGAEHVETDPAVLREHGVGQYAGRDEAEIPLKSSAPVRVSAVHYWDRHPADPADGSWKRVR